MAPEILSLLGLTQLKETIDSVREKLNPSLNVLGLILTKYNRRTLLAREVKEMAENIAEQIGSCVFHTQIRASVSVAEAPAHGLSVYDHAPRSNPSLDYKEFVKEVMDKITTVSMEANNGKKSNKTAHVLNLLSGHDTKKEPEKELETDVKKDADPISEQDSQPRMPNNRTRSGTDRKNPTGKNICSRFPLCLDHRSDGKRSGGRTDSGKSLSGISKRT